MLLFNISFRAFYFNVVAILRAQQTRDHFERGRFFPSENEQVEMAKMQVGSRVVGKTARTRGKVGVVLGVRHTSRQREYDVRWSSGAEETVSARAITLAVEQATQRDDASIAQQAGSFTELLLQSRAVNTADIDSSMSSASDDDDVAASAESEDDGTIHANGRRWIPCTSVLLDPGAHVQPRRPLLLWPQSIAFGEKSLVKYFYLMYPMATLESTVANTNINHGS